MQPDVEKEALSQQENVEHTPSSFKPKSTSKLLLLLLAISFSLSFALLHLYNSPSSLDALLSDSISFVLHQEQNPHHIVAPFNFSSPVMLYPERLPEPERYRHPFFQSTSSSIKLNSTSPLIFVRADSGTSISVRSSENLEGERDPWEGEIPNEDEIIVVVRARWPEIEDWEMKKWGMKELARLYGGEAVRKETDGLATAVGILLDAPTPGLPWEKPGRPPPINQVVLLGTLITLVVSPRFRGRDLEITRIPNRNQNFRLYAPTGLDSGTGSFEDVDVKAEVGYAGATKFNSSFTARSLSISFSNGDGPSFGSVESAYYNSSFALSNFLNVSIPDYGQVDLKLSNHPSRSPSSPSLTATITVGQGLDELADYRVGLISLSLPKGSFEGEFSARTAYGDMDVDVVPEKGQVVEIEKVGRWDGGLKKGPGFEFAGTIRKKEGERKGEGRIELLSSEGLVELKIA